MRPTCLFSQAAFNKVCIVHPSFAKQANAGDPEK